MSDRKHTSAGAEKMEHAEKNGPTRPGERFIHRELSWLEFNDRVLREGLSPTVPLMERLKFLAIVRSNLDEFFMVRVAGLMQQRTAGIETPDPSGMTPVTQLARIAERAHQLVAEQEAGVADVLGELVPEGLTVLERSQWTESQRAKIAKLFRAEIAPVATPMAIEELPEPPLLANLQVYVGLLLEARIDSVVTTDELGALDETPNGVSGERAKPAKSEVVKSGTAMGDEPAVTVAVIPVPRCLPRFFRIAADSETPAEVLVTPEDILLAHAEELFPGRRIPDRALLRITRDGNVEIHDDNAADLCEMINVAVSDRRRRAAVRLEISVDASERLRARLSKRFGLADQDCYPIGRFPEASALFELAGWDGYEHLRYESWDAELPQELPDDEDLWDVLRERDVLLLHPYETFDPVVRMVQRAAEDPDVLAIRQTLYRTSGDSPIVRSLELAASRGKDVTVLVELKARFDEARNVVWARRLEDAGCHVLYGIAGLKTHAKALLIVRREDGRLRRYAHLATGNYNDRTARIYSDLGVMTSDRVLTADVAAFFNLITGCSDAVGWERITCEPGFLRRRFIELIRRVADLSTPERPGRILAKMNSLEDPKIIEELYRANRCGVRIGLNIRGICCLRPGVPGLSEHIEVRSIIDRYLEHARVFYFSAGGHEEVYLSSADWMVRNLQQRFEMLFPITTPSIRRRILHILSIYFADTVKTRILQPDGLWRAALEMPGSGVYGSSGGELLWLPDAEIVEEIENGEQIRAQEKLHTEAISAAQEIRGAMPRFRPLQAPKES